MDTPQANLTENAFHFTRILDAPRALVYRMWTEAAHFKLWWGPHTFSNTCTMDARVGGRYAVTMISPQGEENPLLKRLRNLASQRHTEMAEFMFSLKKEQAKLKAEIIVELWANGVAMDLIARSTKLSMEEVNDILQAAQNAPDSGNS